MHLFMDIVVEIMPIRVECDASPHLASSRQIPCQHEKKDIK